MQYEEDWGQQLVHPLSVLYVRMFLSITEQYLEHGVPGVVGGGGVRSGRRGKGVGGGVKEWGGG